MFKWLKNLFPIIDTSEAPSREVYVKDTPESKLWAQIATNRCPDCDHEGFLEGPSGGISTNIKCANAECGARFNITPLIGIAERI